MQSRFLRARAYAKELFPGSEIVRKFSFKMIGTRNLSALLAVANLRLSQVARGLGAESAYFYINDCFECLTPHISTA